MSKTKNTKKIKLAPVPSLTLAGEQAPAPERLMRAGYTVASSIIGGKVQIIGLDKKDRPVGADGVVRLSEAPLDRLAARGRLAEGNPDRNTALFEAGHKLRRHVYHAGLSGLGGVNLMGARGEGSPAWLTPSSESAAYHRGQVRRIRGCMDADHWRIVVGVVCAEETLEEAGRAAGFGQKHAAIGVALDRLRRGLELAGVECGFLAPVPANDDEARQANTDRARAVALAVDGLSDAAADPAQTLAEVTAALARVQKQTDAAVFADRRARQAAALLAEAMAAFAAAVEAKAA